MPTALDVVADEVATPPTSAMKKEEGHKITPLVTAEKPKKKAQPSIMSFFKKPSSKNLFTKTPSKFPTNDPAASPMKSASPTNKAVAPTTSKDEEAVTKPPARPSGTIKKTTTKPSPLNKSQSMASKHSSKIPTKEELMDIVLGSASKRDEVIVATEPIVLPPKAESSVLPVLTMPIPCLKKKPVEDTSPSTYPAVAGETEAVSAAIAIVASETAESANAHEASTPVNAPAAKEDSVDANIQGRNGDTEIFASPKAAAAAPEPDETADSGGSTKAAPSAAKEGSARDKANETSRDDLITFVRFVHDCSLPSKEKAIKELRTVHKTITSSYAQAMRTLDSIAEKKRKANGGVFWEIRKDVLEELGLDELLKKQAEVPTNPSTKTKAPKAPPSTTKNATAETDTSMDCEDLTQDDAVKPAPKEQKIVIQNVSAKSPVVSNEIKPNEAISAGSKAALEISAERQALLAKHDTLREENNRRLKELIKKARDGLDEEDFQLPAPTLSAEDGEFPASLADFPDFAIPSLALVVQESKLSLSDLVDTAIIQLHEAFPSVEFHAENVASKIKLLATRDSYVQNLDSLSVNSFEDSSTDRMWRWEIISLELLPSDCMANVKRARTARKKLRSHSKALCDLLKVLDQAKTLLQDPGSCQTKCDALSTKISNAEEKVLKFEREAEKSRIAEEAKKKKETDKAMKEQDKQKEKAEAQELKKVKKEELKRKKDEEKQKEQEEKERKLKKQRMMMMSFLSQKSPDAIRNQQSKPPPTASSAAVVDTEKFWSSLSTSDHHESGPLFPKLTPGALTSRVRRTRKVPVQVYETVIPDDNALGAQPYAEPKTIHVANKYKYLSFYEDVRPPYHGTWSKGKSLLVTGKNPFGQDTKHLDYDVDSEAEWEEGDCEVGEDVEDEGADDEEESIDGEEADDQDGFFCDDDDLGSEDEEIDEETKLLRKKKLQAINGSSQKKAVIGQDTICIIAPGPGGKPVDESLNNQAKESELIEGVGPREALSLLSSHTVRILTSEGPCLDAFPPPLIEEGNLDAPAPKVGSDEMSRDDLIIFVEFVHHCSLPSKDRVIEELRTVHKAITSSRAQAARKLDAIAEKKRKPNGGVYWEVRRDVLEELGLDELLKKEIEVPTNPPSEDEMSRDDLIIFVEFVHHCSLPSKDKLIEDLRTVHKTVTSSRAQATRKLDAIAEKKRNPNGGVYWEVRRDVLEELGLNKLLDKQIEVPTNLQSETKAEKAPSATKSVPPVPSKSDVAKSSEKKPDTANSNEKGSKKRALPDVSASAKLFAEYLKKKTKTETK